MRVDDVVKLLQGLYPPWSGNHVLAFVEEDDAAVFHRTELTEFLPLLHESVFPFFFPDVLAHQLDDDVWVELDELFP